MVTHIEPCPVLPRFHDLLLVQLVFHLLEILSRKQGIRHYPALTIDNGGGIGNLVAKGIQLAVCSGPTEVEQRFHQAGLVPQVVAHDVEMKSLDISLIPGQQQESTAKSSQRVDEDSRPANFHTIFKPGLCIGCRNEGPQAPG